MSRSNIEQACYELLSISEFNPQTNKKLINAIDTIRFEYTNLESKYNYMKLLYELSLDNQIRWMLNDKKLRNVIIEFLIHWNSPNRLSASLELEKAGNELNHVIK